MPAGGHFAVDDAERFERFQFNSLGQPEQVAQGQNIGELLYRDANRRRPYNADCAGRNEGGNSRSTGEGNGKTGRTSPVDSHKCQRVLPGSEHMLWNDRHAHLVAESRLVVEQLDTRQPIAGDSDDVKFVVHERDINCGGCHVVYLFLWENARLIRTLQIAQRYACNLTNSDATTVIVSSKHN